MINCFVCEKDITNGVKVVDLYKTEPLHEFKACTDCAAKDLAARHQKYVLDKHVCAVPSAPEYALTAKDTQTV